MRIKKDNSFRKKVRLHTIDGLFIEGYLVAKKKYVYILRNELDQAKEFSVYKRHVIRKSALNSNKSKYVAGRKEELLMIGRGETWDSYYTGLGAVYCVPFGYMGDNFKDGLGINIRVFNSPGKNFFWGIGTGATIFRTVEETQLRNLNSIQIHVDLMAGYTFNIIRNRLSLSLYGGSGYNFFMLGHNGDPMVDSSSNQLDSINYFEPRYFHYPSIITGIQLPIRVFRRMNILTFIEHQWFPSKKAYLGLLNIGLTINW